MPWPWVPSAWHDSVVGGLNNYNNYLRDERTELKAEIQRLTNVIIELRREGFNPAPPAGRLESLDLDLDQGVLDAIEQRSQGDPGLQRKLTRWALAEMRQDGTAEDVATRILRGSAHEEEE